jgi:1,2-beta-oligoglucan phosphorylase
MNKINSFLNLAADDMEYRFLPTGDVFTFNCGKFLINQLRGNVRDGSVNNIYLRIYEAGVKKVYPLLGIRSTSKVYHSVNAIIYEGDIMDISYKVTFRPINQFWFWNVTLTGTNKEVDLIYGQDLGIGTTGGVFTNELYNSQYLGHSVFEGPNGYVICSRQNMPSADTFPYIQQGIIGSKAIHYSTDGLQFFGLSYKETDIPEILSSDLADVNLQYEFSYTALQTEKITLNGVHSLTFYGVFMQNHPEAVKEIEYQGLLWHAYEKSQLPLKEVKPVQSVTKKSEFGRPYSSPSFTMEEINAFYPDKKLEEYEEDKLLSFFTNDHAHLVTKDKELLSERPHGTIIITPPNSSKIDSHLISSTGYMFGVFNSHVVLGNTDFHKLMSSTRGFLNNFKNSGQRIYFSLAGTYHLLTLPALFEMGMNYSKWYYKLPEDTLVITVFTAVSSSDLVMEVKSDKGKKYDYIITNQITAGTTEYDHDITYTTVKDGLRFTLDTDTYPGVHYDILLPGHTFTINDDSIFFEEGISCDETFLTLSLKQEQSIALHIKGYLSADETPRSCNYIFEEEKLGALSYYNSLINHFHLETDKTVDEKISILNETAWWYAHNAMIHFSMPHGLEQPGGAAWGTRDVCQGPMEFFLATQNYKIMRQILLNIFSHQNIETKEWPQWFMFDEYSLNPGECHGDVIFWPLKSLADYLQATEDAVILTELLPYDGAPDKKETLMDHIKYALNNIKTSRFINDTGLITYAGGDWDDTLQPASEEMKEKLVSSWTVALAFQTFSSLSISLNKIDNVLSDELSLLAEKVKKAFHDILIKDGVIAGFLECGETYNHMLHPSDTTTGIHYRLLPMTRSIIAELVDKEQAKRSVATIQEKLKCPDGVRIMDCPAHYDGGVSRLFKRAEQAANVGREISLQYTHAHIRYIEAMAKLGYGKEAWDSLFTINPILLRHSVANANNRQSNLYFSSSDGAFSDRYEYEKNFHLLKTGDIKVKGGWRLYSSGPGIYFRQLVSNVLGIRFCKAGLVIDPALPKELDGLTFTYDCFGKTFCFTYKLTNNNTLSVSCGGNNIPSSTVTNPYRNGGILISREDLLKCEDIIIIHAVANE